MTITIQRDMHYPGDHFDIGKPRRWDHLDKVIGAILSYVKTLQEYRLTDDGLVLILRKSLGNGSQEVVKITGIGDEIELLERIVDAGRQLIHAKRDSVFDLMTDRDGTQMFRLHRDEREHITNDIFRGSLPWKVIAVMRAFRFQMNWETIARWNDDDRFDEFLMIAVLARQYNKPFEDMENELAPADSPAKV